MKKLKSLSILLMALALCVSCLSVSTYAAQVRLNYSEVSLFVGKSKTLKVKGTKNKATWKSSNKKIATVSKTGKVLGKKAGTAVITATVGGNSYKCSVTVKNPQLNESKESPVQKQNRSVLPTKRSQRCRTRVLSPRKKAALLLLPYRPEAKS